MRWRSVSAVTATSMFLLAWAPTEVAPADEALIASEASFTVSERPLMSRNMSPVLDRASTRPCPSDRAARPAA